MTIDFCKYHTNEPDQGPCDPCWCNDACNFELAEPWASAKRLLERLEEMTIALETLALEARALITEVKGGIK